MNGAQWVVHALRTQGVDTVFGYPGGAIMPVYDALYDGGVEHLLCRHEQGAAMAAIGYARATGKTGVCIATSGPGATNLITGLADALLDSVPVVAITGQVAAPFIGTDAFQEVDVLGLSLACTKHSFLVQSLEELPRVIAEAFQVANSGRPGPVLVDIPKDIQLAKGELDPHFSTVPDDVEFPHTQVEQALAMLAQSHKPMLYVGGGVGMAQAVPAVREFLAVTQMPVTCTLKGLGAVAADYPYYLGMLGMHGTKAANLAVQECDLLIAVGARFDDRVTGKLNTFAPHAKVIHMDIDPAELNKLRQAHVALTGDLNAMLPAVGHRCVARAQRTAARGARLALRSSRRGNLRAAVAQAAFRSQTGGLRRDDRCRPAPNVVGPAHDLYPPGKLHHFQRPRHHGFWSAGSRWRAGGSPGRYGYLYLRRWLFHDECAGAGHR